MKVLLFLMMLLLCSYCENKICKERGHIKQYLGKQSYYNNSFSGFSDEFSFEKSVIIDYPDSVIRKTYYILECTNKYRCERCDKRWTIDKSDSTLIKYEVVWVSLD